MWPLFVRGERPRRGSSRLLFGLRAAFRLKGHFHDRHYKPIESGRVDQSEHIGDRPLSWWAVRRVMEYSGRVNVWLAGGFCFLYAAFIVAGQPLAGVDGPARLPDLRDLGRCAGRRDGDVRAGRGAGGVPVRTVGLDRLEPLQAARTAPAHRAERPRLLARVAGGRVAARPRLPHHRGDCSGSRWRSPAAWPGTRPSRAALGGLAAVGVLVRGRLPGVLARAVRRTAWRRC